MFNYNHLFYFYVTVRSGGITRAAKSLKIAQPSLSAQIKSLENRLERVLFERKGRGIRLTPDGEMLFGYCRKMFDFAEQMDRALSTGSAGRERVMIGVSSEIERPFLVNVVGSLLKKRPSSEDIPNVTMVSDSHEGLIHRLRTRGVDAVITNQPAFDSELATLVEAQIPVVLAFKKKGDYSFLKRSNPSSYPNVFGDRDLRWLLPLAGLRLRQETETYFEEIGIAPRVVFETDVLATLVRAIAEDVGVALLPLLYIQSAQMLRAQIDWVGPSQGIWKHRFWVIYRARDVSSDAMAQLKSSFEQGLRVT